MLGDVISLEPVARALYQKFGQKVVVDCGDFAPVFKHHPGIKFGSSLSNDTDLRPGFGMDKNFSDADLQFDLNNCYEQSHFRLREDSYAEFCGISLPDEQKTPKIYMTSEELMWGEDVLGTGSWLVLDIGYCESGFLVARDARGQDRKWQRAHWPVAQWVTLVKDLQSLGIKVVQIGNRLDISAVPGVNLDLRGKTNLRELFGLIRACEFFVGMEYGPMHIAQAFGLRGVGIFHPMGPAHIYKTPGSRITEVYREPGDSIKEEQIVNAIVSHLNRLNA